MSDTQSFLIDTHCHLDNATYSEDLGEVIARAEERGVRQVIIPAAFVPTLPRAREIAHSYEGVYFAAGVHPTDLDGFDMEVFRQYASDPKCVAIGECGLDYYRLEGSLEAMEREKAHQKACFRAQIELSIELHLPLIVHVREASNDCFEILQSYPKAYGVLHCYNADRILLGLSERFYYGIGGVCTFKNARRLLEVLPLIPKDRLVLETDAPYLTPHPHRGTRNEPSYIPLILAQMAEVLGVEQNELMELTTANAHRLFKELVSSTPKEPSKNTNCGHLHTATTALKGLL